MQVGSLQISIDPCTVTKKQLLRFSGCLSKIQVPGLDFDYKGHFHRPYRCTWTNVL